MYVRTYYVRMRTHSTQTMHTHTVRTHNTHVRMRTHPVLSC